MKRVFPARYLKNTQKNKCSFQIPKKLPKYSGASCILLKQFILLTSQNTYETPTIHNSQPETFEYDPIFMQLHLIHHGICH